jgi:hypothetical protein
LTRSSVKTGIFSLLGFILLVVFGCEKSPLEPESTLIVPTIKGIRVTGIATSGLGALVTVQASNSISVAIAVSRDSLLEQITPGVTVHGDSAIVPVLGLRANKSYTFSAVAVSSSANTTTSAPITYATQPLPKGMPQFNVVSSRSPSVRFIMLGITPAKDGKSYAVVIDTGGNPVWYKEFQDAVADFQRQPNGRYTAWSSTDGSPSHFYEFDKQGTVTAEYKASNGLATDPHELRVRGDSYALFGLQSQTLDLSAVSGLLNASVQGFVVEFYRPGRQQFYWSTLDHFALTDATSDISLQGKTVDPWHGNAIEIDLDDHLLVSFRNMDEITKINTLTGEIIWRLGGKHNQFSFRNDNLNGFSHQHAVRRLDNGNIILFDDGSLHSPQTSRAVEYKLDENGKTADLVWEYRPDPPLFGSALGFAQRLSNGNTLVCFGTAQHIIEVDNSGTKRWEIAITDPQRYAYRAIAIESLY